jgi:hypothetical protein
MLLERSEESYSIVTIEDAIADAEEEKYSEPSDEHEYDL